jgi:hypothetical protein
VIKARGPETSFAWIASPALPYPIPKAAYDASIVARDGAAWWSFPLAFVTGAFSGFESNARRPLHIEGGEECFVYDGIINLQGPNYALAKTLQNWRALLLHSTGHRISANFAPPAMTLSVTHNTTAATALKGITAFEPHMAFEGETVSPIMTALLIYDLVKPGTEVFSNPYHLFLSTAWHGGGWRSAWKYDSIGTAAFLFGFFK